jgi:hypothetical protein
MTISGPWTNLCKVLDVFTFTSSAKESQLINLKSSFVIRIRKLNFEKVF